MGNDSGFGQGLDRVGTNIGSGLSQGLGVLTSIADLITAAHSGNLGGALARQAGMTQDPNIRATIEGSPFLAGFTRTFGGVKPIGVGGAPSGGGAGVPTDWQFRAGLPPLGEQALAELRLEQAKGPYTEAQTRHLGAESDYLNNSDALLAGGAPAGMRLTGMTRGPNGTVAAYTAPEMKTLRYPKGSVVGTDPRTGQTTIEEPPRATSAGGAAGVASRRRLAGAETAIGFIDRFEKEPIGKIGKKDYYAIDVMPGAGYAAASEILPMGPLDPKSRLEIVAKFANTDLNTVSPLALRPAMAIAGTSDPQEFALYAIGAQRALQLSEGIVLPIRTALGDTANAAVQEQLNTMKALGLAGNESRGQLEEKLKGTRAALNNIVNAIRADPVEQARLAAHPDQAAVVGALLPESGIGGAAASGTDPGESVAGAMARGKAGGTTPSAPSVNAEAPGSSMAPGANVAGPPTATPGAAMTVEDAVKAIRGQGAKKVGRAGR